MSFLKINENQFLGKQELNKLVDFLSVDGYKSIFQASVREYGVLNDLVSDNEFNNLRVTIGSAFNKLDLMPGQAIDGDINIINVNETVEDFYEIPADNAWRYIKIKHSYSDEEEGLVALSVAGDLTGTNTKFTESLRGQPYHAIKVKFKDSSLNTLEYEVLEVLSDTQAKLSGSSFSNEIDLKLSVVGTFSPGIDPAADHKFIYQYDSFTVYIENTETVSNKNYEFLLARVKNESGTVTVEDLRSTNTFTLNSPYGEPITTLFNTLLGIEKINWGGLYNNESDHNITIGWGFRSVEGDWSVDSLNSTITVNAGLGGVYDSISDVATGDFDGWRVYFKNGESANIVSSNKSVGTLLLDMRDLSNPSTDGELVIVPNADFIEFLTSDEDQDYIGSANLKTTLFSISRGYGVVKMFYTPDRKTINWRLKSARHTTEWKVINDGDYNNETSFDANGILDSAITSSVISGVFQLSKSPDNWREYKAWIHKLNRFTALQEFNLASIIQNSNKVIDLLDTGNTIPVDVVNDDLVGIIRKAEGTEINLVFNDEVTIRVSENLTAQQITDGFIPFTTPNGNDLGIPSGDIIKVVQYKDTWKVLSIPSQLQLPTSIPPIGGVIMWSGSYATNFDTSGLGISTTQGTLGWALCNGNNNTPDLRGRFIVGAINNMPSVGAPDLASEIDPSEGHRNYDIGDIGGEDKHELTKLELPKHTHEAGTLEITGGEHVHNLESSAGDGGGFGEKFDMTDGTALNTLTTEDGDGGHTHQSDEFNGATEDGTEDGLEGAAHNNLPPYYSLAYIMRIA